ncbi:MAG: tRNA (guanosine(37)-N1)-methyltransferase TrmD [Candidatus Bipolaricaulota bacterium]|nr:MAG: tRNA (guanosine(37)-N1)-methyltransferase TrmD [Candidatus Bipolaricaulota bacterium]
MRVDVVTVFPESLDSLLSVGVIGQARADGRFELHTHDLRSFTDDPHRVVDDRAYGGGPGMVMMIEPLVRAIEAVRLPTGERRVVLLSPQGRTFRQEDAGQWATLDQLVLLCGRYQGVDERIVHFIDEEISIGDYVLAGGEAAAAVIVEATARMVPGVVGQYQSVAGDSFYERRALGAPQYTRPQSFRGHDVPDVLLSGDHERIERARERWAWEKTVRNRPDLLGLRVDPSRDDG